MRNLQLILTNSSSKRSEIQKHRIRGLLCLIFLTSIGLLFGVCGWYASSHGETGDSSEALDYQARTAYNFNLGLHNAIFMASEIGLLAIPTLQSLIICIGEQLKQKYARNRGRVVPRGTKKEGGSISHAITFYFDIAALLFDLVG